jgi:hypothetical protein
MLLHHILNVKLDIVQDHVQDRQLHCMDATTCLALATSAALELKELF